MAYETPPDSFLAVTDPDKLCTPDADRHCACTPTRTWLTLETPTVKAPGPTPQTWTVADYLGRPAPASLFPAMHTYAQPGSVAYAAVTDALQKGTSSKWNRPYTDLNVPIPADGSFRYPSRPGYLPRELFASSPTSKEAAAGVYFQTPAAGTACVAP